VCNFFVQGCRNVEAGELVKKVIKSRGTVSGEVTCFQLDVGSFKSIKTFAELVLERFPRVDLLVNNGMYMLLTYYCTAWWSSRNVVDWEGMQVEALMFILWTV
jgi:NAD(P)-dependent dehydrogenase (short-subunit alcohol dehydrogenase family)